MRRVGVIIFSLLMLVFTSSICLADSDPDEVVTLCPDVKDLVKGGLSETMPFTYAGIPLYLVMKYGNYKTKWDWAFVVAIPQFEVSDRAEAYDSAMSALSQVKGSPSPVRSVFYDREHNKEYVKWVCMYEHLDYFVLTVTPTSLPSVVAAFNMSGSLRKLQGKSSQAQALLVRSIY